MFKTLLIASATLAVAAAPIAASAAPYGGQWGGRGFTGARLDHGNGGAALAAGLFGLAIGAAIASNHDHDYGYGYGYGYRPYETRCWWETQAVRGPYGYVHYEQVQVCR